MGDGVTAKQGAQTLSESDVLNPGGAGRYVLAASAANESAFERDGKSIYTEFMVEALRTGVAAPDKAEVTVDDLHDYLVRRVGNDVVPMRPHIWKSGVNTPLVIARNPNPRKPLPLDLVDALFDSDVLRAQGAVAGLLRLHAGSDLRLAHDAEQVLRERLNKTEGLMWDVGQAIRDGLDQPARPIVATQPPKVDEPKRPTPVHARESEPNERVNKKPEGAWSREAIALTALCAIVGVLYVWQFLR